MVDKVDITIAHLGSLFIAFSSNSQQSSQQEVTNFQLCVNLRKCTNSTQYLPWAKYQKYQNIKTIKYQKIKVSQQVSQVSQQVRTLQKQQQQQILAVLKDGEWFVCNNKIILWSISGFQY